MTNLTEPKPLGGIDFACRVKVLGLTHAEAEAAFKVGPGQIARWGNGKDAIPLGIEDEIDALMERVELYVDMLIDSAAPFFMNDTYTPATSPVPTDPIVIPLTSIITAWTGEPEDIPLLKRAAGEARIAIIDSAESDDYGIFGLEVVIE